MICALMIGRKGSQGFPKKNLFPVLGKPMCEYPIIAANNSNFIDKIYVSTDDEEIKKIAKKNNAEIIERPQNLLTNTALGENVFQHGYYEIKKRLKEYNIKYMILLFANSPTVNSDLIDRGIEILEKETSYDSAVSTSIYNMWSPLRARKLSKDGNLVPFVDFNYFGNVENLNCDRGSQGDVYYADMSVSVVRPHCLENLESGLLPQKWMGKKIAPIHSWGGCDVDFEWQVPQAEYWLKKNLSN